MDEARVVSSGEVITAEELYFINDVASMKFCCDECEVSLIPCSYIKDVNLKKPYFKTFSGRNHESWCEAEGASNKRAEGKTSRLTVDEGFPLAYPNRFRLRKENVVDNDFEPSDRTTQKSRRGLKKANDFRGLTRKSNYETSSFKSIVNEYFDFPHDRDRELFFEGINGSSYETVFKKIRNTIGKQQFRLQGDEVKIYYSTISWRLSDLEDEVLRVELSSGKWLNNKQERAYYVEIDMSEWPKQSKTKFIKRYREVVETVRGTSNKALIAFVGYQDTDKDFFRFFAESRFLIAFKLFHDV